MSGWKLSKAVSLAVLIGAMGCGNADVGGGDDDIDGSTGDGGPIADANGNPHDGLGEQCGQLTAVLRDFKASHPDMEGNIQSLEGIVEVDLGADDKPVYAPPGATSVTAGQEFFDQWYRDVDGVNMHFEIPIPLTESSPGQFMFDDDEFFPLDGQGWPGEEIAGHNFHFTTEIHGTFKYKGGEVFTFTGDDDVFVFVNRKLGLDLGGVHGSQSKTIDFDNQSSQLGIAVGGIYRLDVFHAERRTSESHFRIETSIDCLVIE